MPLEHLFERNVAWVARKTEEDPTFFQRMAVQQTPNYLWIGCSDSRVTANDVLDLDPGEVFVHRNIANMVHTSDMNLLAVIEFAVETLRVRHIIVCGHYGCGGVRRALGNERTALVDHWLQPLVMLYRKHQPVFRALPSDAARLDRMCELNIEMQVRRIAQTPILEGAWDRAQPVSIHGWVYGIEDGLIRDLGSTISSVDDREALGNIDDCVTAPARIGKGAPRRSIVPLEQAECPCCALPPSGPA